MFQHGKRGMGFEKAAKDPVIEDGHSGFFDNKKKGQNRFANIDEVN